MEPTDFLSIDERRLDRECLRHAELVFEYGQKQADARAAHDAIKQELEVHCADLSYRIRDNPGKFGLEKVTEGAIKDKITSDKKAAEFLADLANAKHKMDILAAAVNALEHRKRMLVLMVELLSINYHSDPAVSREGRQAVETKTKEEVRRLGAIPGKKKPDKHSDRDDD